jgi:N6-adenosine-specific RNA methylase IME4
MNLTANYNDLTPISYRAQIVDGCKIEDLIWLGETGCRAVTIYCDPPWKFRARSIKGMGRSAERHYATMTAAELAAMRPAIDAIAAKDSVLLMWSTMPHLAQAIALLDAWGFTYKTVAFTWVKIAAETGKPVDGMGFWTRANAEIVLLATRGHPKRQAKDVAQIITARRRGHSVKPPAVRTRIERLLGGPRLELFARQTAPGWIAWGNQIPKEEFRAVVAGEGWIQ